jgi:uncharacterized protein
MKKEVVQIYPVSLLPTPMGCAMFLGDGNKVICMYIDPSVGASLNDFLNNHEPERPQSHDFFHSLIVLCRS